MSSAFPSEVQHADLEQMVRLAGESFAFEAEDNDEPMLPTRDVPDWGWRVVGLILSLSVFAAAVLTIR